MKITSEKINLKGGEVRYLHGGFGPRVLLLHGWGSSAEKYEETFKHLPEDSMTIIAPDLPGFGATPLYSEQWALKDYAKWVEDFIAAVGWRECVLAGHSFGGRVSILLASKQSLFISGLILYAAAGVSARSEKKLNFWRAVAKLGIPDKKGISSIETANKAAATTAVKPLRPPVAMPEADSI